MLNDRNAAWKLGVCGWEPYPDIEMTSMPICGTAVGGAIFCGSRTCQYYSDETETWTKTSEMPNSHNDGNIISAGGYVFVIGGQSGDQNIDRYDPATDTWQTFDMEENGLPKEYKGFAVTKGPIEDSFMTSAVRF